MDYYWIYSNNRRLIFFSKVIALTILLVIAANFFFVLIPFAYLEPFSANIKFHDSNTLLIQPGQDFDLSRVRFRKVDQGLLKVHFMSTMPVQMNRTISLRSYFSADQDGVSSYTYQSPALTLRKNGRLVLNFTANNYADAKRTFACTVNIFTRKMFSLQGKGTETTITEFSASNLASGELLTVDFLRPSDLPNNPLEEYFVELRSKTIGPANFSVSLSTETASWEIKDSSQMNGSCISNCKWNSISDPPYILLNYDRKDSIVGLVGRFTYPTQLQYDIPEISIIILSILLAVAVVSTGAFDRLFIRGGKISRPQVVSEKGLIV